MKGMASSLPVGAPPRVRTTLPGNTGIAGVAQIRTRGGCSYTNKPGSAQAVVGSPPACPAAVTRAPPGRPAVSVMRSTSYQPNKPSHPKAFVDTPDIPGIGKALRRLSTHPEKFFRKRLKLLASTPIKGLNANIMGVWASPDP